jgi:hypothetical protein
MSKIIQALLSGMLSTFILDFFLFLGIKQNYIDLYGINLYYNILFADNQNIFIYSFFTIFLGYILVYLNNKISLIVLALLSALSLLTLIPSIGKGVGEFILMKKDVFIKTQRFSYHGDILYNGRKTITFHDYQIDKILHIKKDKIKGDY